MSVRTTTTYYVVHEGQEFETTHEPIEGSEKITIKENKALVSYLVSDAAQCSWYFHDYECGRFITRDGRSLGERLGDEEINELFLAHPGRVFLINKYEHGLCRYYRQGDAQTSASVPDQRWDVAHGSAVFVVPDDVPEPEKYCDSIMKNFTDWCNGDIYGVCHETYDLTEGKWVPDTEDSCWGYIGSENAERERDEDHESRSQ